MTSFGEETGGAKAGIAVSVVVLGLWLALSGVVVFVVTALGLGSCSSDDGCVDRAGFALVAIPVVHVLGLLLGAWLVLKRSTTGRRVGALLAIAVLVPAGSLVGAILLVVGLQPDP